MLPKSLAAAAQAFVAKLNSPPTDGLSAAASPAWVPALLVPDASAAERPAPARSSVRLFMECSSIRSRRALFALLSLQIGAVAAFGQSAPRGIDIPEIRENSCGFRDAPQRGVI